MTIATTEMLELCSPVQQVIEHITMRSQSDTGQSLEFLGPTSTYIAVIDDLNQMQSIRDELAIMRSVMDEPKVYDPREADAILRAINGPATTIRGAALRRRD